MKNVVQLHQIHKERVSNLYGKNHVVDSIRKSHSVRTVFAKIAWHNENNDVLEKGGIASELRYNGQLLVEKTGKEVKEALTKFSQLYEEQKNTLALELAELKGRIGIEPMQDLSNYSYDRLKARFGNTNLWCYSWEQRRRCENPGDSAEPAAIQAYKESDASCSMMDQYNDKLYKYAELCVEMCYMDTLLNNLNDTKKYALSIEQAAMLGF